MYVNNLVNRLKRKNAQKMLNTEYLDSIKEVDFKNCKYNNRELAYRFIDIASKLLDLYNTTQTIVDFDEFYIIRSVSGIRANYSGFIVAAVLPNDIHDFNAQTSVKFVSEYLGFASVNNLANFFSDNEKVFGFNYDLVFSDIGYLAFNKIGDSVTLLDIVQKHIEIADNLRLIGEI